MTRNPGTPSRVQQRMMSAFHRYLILALLGGLTAVAQMPDTVLDDAFQAWVAAETTAWRAAAAERHDVRIEPGLRADRQAREVELLAVAAGVAPPTENRAGDPVEFILVQPHGRGYEALAVTPVRARLLHRALQWIGMEPGVPVAPAVHRYWPRGERVVITVAWTTNDPETGAPVEHRARAESLLWDRREQAPLPARGFVFVGSFEYPDDAGANRYAADTTGDIVSNYNDGAVVLDVPYLAVQGERYGHIVLNPESAPPAGTRLHVFLRPELPAGQTRTRDFTLRPSIVGESVEPSAADLRFTWLDGADQPLLEGAAFAQLLAAIQRQYAANHDVWIRLDVPASLPLAPMAEFAAMLRAIAERNIIRLQPPGEGQFFYRAFLPDPAWRDRDKRPSQPLEVHLTDGPAGRLVWIDEQYGDRGRVLTPHEFPFTDPAALARLVADRDDWGTDVILVYAPPRTPLARLHAYYDPLAEVFPTVYLFTGD